MPIDEVKLPNFFLVGAPKVGTTSLNDHLDQHPQIYMSPLKEPMYFAEELRPEHMAGEVREKTEQLMVELRKYLDSPPYAKRMGGYISEWEDYCRLFAGARHELAIGEASTMYLWSKTAAARIAARIPHAKIMMILRDPADRVFSKYRQMASVPNYGKTFQQHLEAEQAHKEKDKIGMEYPSLDLGFYSWQLQRYRQHFPAEQIRTWLYEDTRSENFIREVYEFLGVDSGFRPDRSKRHLQQQVPRAPGFNRLLREVGITQTLRRIMPEGARGPLRKLIFKPRSAVQMTPAERAMLVEFYRQDVRKLEEMLGRDLSAWLR